MLLGPNTGIRLPSRASTDDLIVYIETPDRQVHRPEYVNLKDHKISIRYTPFQVGTHLINIYYQGSPINGSPFPFYVDSGGLKRHDGIDMSLRVSQQHNETAAQVAKTHHVGLHAGSSGGGLIFSRPVASVVYVGICYQLRLRSADGLELDKTMLVTFDGPEKVDVDLEDRSRREYQLSYTFFAPGEYMMRVLVGGRDILNPIPVRVVGEAVGVSSGGSFFKTTTTSNYSTNGGGGGGGSDGAWFSSARHLAFGSNEAGALYSGGSTELRHSDVCIYGEGVDHGWTGRECVFEVQLPWNATAESGPMTVTVDGPSKVDLLYEEVAHNVFRFRYTPTRPGEYFVAIKLGPGMKHVLASPYRVTVR